MNIAFCGLKHDHIFALYRMASENSDITVLGAWDDEEAYRAKARGVIREPFYENEEALLRDSRVDIVAVGDAYGARGQMTIRALSMGKHVLSDKPLCTRIEELDEIERISREKHLCVGCMLDLRYDPALRTAGEMMLAGKIGEVHGINFTGQHPLNYGVRPSWYFEKERHGGTFNDLAIHGLDAVRVMTGLKYKSTLCARLFNAFSHEKPDFMDSAQMMAELENGAGLTADVSYSAPNKTGFSLPSYWRFNFWGEGGSIECKLGASNILLAQKNGECMRIPARPVENNCLSELINAIHGRDTQYDAEILFESTRNALTLQKDAESACFKR